MMDLEKARLDFDALQKKIAAFTHATSLIFFDGETSAPSDTLNNRLQSLQILNEEIFNLRTGEETMKLLDYLDENRDWLSVKERRAVDYMLKDSKKKSNIPAGEYIKFEKLITEAQDIWDDAREENDFEIVRPHLEQIFDYYKKIAHYCAPDKDPYEYWLDYYEEGLTLEMCEKLFDAVKEVVVPLIREIKKKPLINDDCIKGDFSRESQESLALFIMELIGVNMNRVGLATAEHPFTTFLGSHFDERIATRYSRKDFSSSMYTVMHQSGHVLYDMGQADNLAYTVLDGGISIGLMEAQGYLYENIIGRSRTFIDYIFEDLREILPGQLDDYTPEDLYRTVNRVNPGLIRIDSGELSNPVHVLIRYELERAIIDGKLAVKDLPEAWREKYKEYFGLDVPDDKTGALQDIHWYFGALGYFPSYVLGGVYAAQIAEKMNERIDLTECLTEGNFKLINFWNEDTIWKHGGLYKSKEIMERFVGAEFSTEPYIRYITEKYKGIYDL